MKGRKPPLDHIHDHGYAEKYLRDPRQKKKIGIVFDPESRNIESWNVG